MVDVSGALRGWTRSLSARVTSGNGTEVGSRAQQGAVHAPRASVACASSLAAVYVRGVFPGAAPVAPMELPQGRPVVVHPRSRGRRQRLLAPARPRGTRHPRLREEGRVFARRVTGKAGRDREIGWLASIRGVELARRVPPPEPALRKPDPFWTEVAAVLGSKVRWSELALGVLRRGETHGWNVMASLMVIVEPNGTVVSDVHVQCYGGSSRVDPRDLNGVLPSLGDEYKLIVVRPDFIVLSRDLADGESFTDAGREIDRWFRRTRIRRRPSGGRWLRVHGGPETSRRPSLRRGLRRVLPGVRGQCDLRSRRDGSARWRRRSRPPRRRRAGF